jgi:hypothetical protein
MEEKSKMKKKKLLSLIAAPIFGLGLNGCMNKYEPFDKTLKKDGFEMHAWSNGSGVNLRLDYGKENIDEPHLYALDKWGNENPDGRFDEIFLKNVPRGDKLEKYANLDSLTVLYKEVLEKGFDSDKYGNIK